LTNERQQSKQHLQTAEQHFKAALSPVKAFILLSKYSKMSLTSHVKATKKEPRLKDPKLYLKDHHNPLLKLKLP